MLEVDRIDTYRGPAQVLRGVSFRVTGDEVVALVGRNGAGKTTTIETITGLLPVRSGRSLRTKITPLPPYRRARLALATPPRIPEFSPISGSPKT